MDEESAHIELVEDPDDEFLKLVRVCPAASTRSTPGKEILRLRGLPRVRHLPHHLQLHHREGRWENPTTHHGRGVPLRLGFQSAASLSSGLPVRRLRAIVHSPAAVARLMSGRAAGLRMRRSSLGRPAGLA